MPNKRDPEKAFLAMWIKRHVLEILDERARKYYRGNRVAAAAAKTRQRRWVELHPAAAAWLTRARLAGSVLPVSAISRKRFEHRLRVVLGFRRWPQNVLRHTAASYLLAEWRDVARVALSLGNSAKVLQSNYLNLVSPEESRRFWLPPEAQQARH